MSLPQLPKHKAQDLGDTTTSSDFTNPKRKKKYEHMYEKNMETYIHDLTERKLNNSSKNMKVLISPARKK